MSMPSFVRHEKVSLKKSPHFNEEWLHERISEDPNLLGLGEVRVLDRERTLSGGGRLDMLLLDDDCASHEKASTNSASFTHCLGFS